VPLGAVQGCVPLGAVQGCVPLGAIQGKMRGLGFMLSAMSISSVSHKSDSAGTFISME
jgi:hypothetical protein